MIAPILETAINQIIIDENIDTRELLNKVVAIKITDIDINLTIIFNSYRVIVLSKEVDNLGIDINITMSPKTFIELIKKQNSKQLIANDKLVIIGDVKIAQALFNIIANIDLENLILNHINSTINKVKRVLSYIR